MPFWGVSSGGFSFAVWKKNRIYVTLVNNGHKYIAYDVRRCFDRNYDRKGMVVMAKTWKGGIAALLIVCMCITSVGCTQKKQTKQPQETSTATAEATAQETGDVSSEEKTKLPEVQAGGKGNNKSDTPFIMACGSLSGDFNPFSSSDEADIRAVDLTQLSLLTFDREGDVVNNAIQGETRSFREEDYFYQGPANIKITYRKKKNETSYIIRIRKDLTFSDGEPVTIDDVIFSMYAFADTDYQGSEEFGNLSIVGLDKYRNSKKAKQIKGIVRLSDYKVKVITKGYHREDVEALDIPICPLHFYGKTTLYNVSKGTYGFTKGDISALTKGKNSPLGAGAYRFIKYEKDIIYYEANEGYYRGCPKTAFVQFKDVGDISDWQKLKDLEAGEYDMVDITASKSSMEMVRQTNGNGKILGKTYSAKLYDGEQYAYIGINAQNVCVNQKADSTRSKNLRTALAILFAACRDNVVEIKEPGAAVIDYPAAHVSWNVPQLENEDYSQAYVKDIDGNVIYRGNMELEERCEAARKAALGYLKAAGFKVKKEKVVKAPENTSLRYVIYVPKAAQDSGASLLVKKTQKLFAEVGLRLVIVDTWTTAKMEKTLAKGKGQIWCSFEKTSVQGDLYGMYHSKSSSDDKAGARNYFQLKDSDLDDYIEQTLRTADTQKSIALYQQCYEKILDWAVEVPLYQERNMTVFRTDTVNYKSLPTNISRYYGWYEEIEELEMN